MHCSDTRVWPKRQPRDTSTSCSNTSKAKGGDARSVYSRTPSGYSNPWHGCQKIESGVVAHTDRCWEFPGYSKLIPSWSALDQFFSAVARNLRSAVATKAMCSPTLAAHFTAVTLAENGATPETHPGVKNDTLVTPLWHIVTCDGLVAPAMASQDPVQHTPSDKACKASSVT